jgi:hypothetical protein
MAATVFFPITVGGLAISTFGNFDACRKSASAEMLAPGAMTPPM